MKRTFYWCSGGYFVWCSFRLKIFCAHFNSVLWWKILFNDFCDFYIFGAVRKGFKGFFMWHPSDLEDLTAITKHANYKTCTYPSWGSGFTAASTHPITAKIIDDTWEGRELVRDFFLELLKATCKVKKSLPSKHGIPSLSNRDILQWKHEIWFES